MSITAIVENDTIKFPVHVPDGTRVEITTLPAAPVAAPAEVRRSSRGFPIVRGRERFSSEDVARLEAEA